MKMVILVAVAMMAMVVLGQHMFFAEKARLLINEMFRDTEYHLKNMPLLGNITIGSLTLSQLRLEPLTADPEFLKGSLAAILQVTYGGQPMDIELTYNAVFKLTEELWLKSSKLKITKLTGLFELLRSTAENMANKFLQKLVGRAIPLDISLPSYVLFGKGESQPNSVNFDFDKYIEHRKKETGWKDEPEQEAETNKATDEQVTYTVEL